ncbi:MAG TPA: TIGR03067 domain-containing protein [Chitinophagaceae bacterium]|nr:TIGR03067 domain-containing protein [Chitinophagaceae bacterium]
MLRSGLLIIASLALACSGLRLNGRTHNLLDGRWIPIRQELGGRELPSATYAGYLLTIKDSVYTYTDHDRGVLSYTGGHMDIYGRAGVNAGKHFTAIYKLDKDTLVVCYNLAGTAYPTAFDTKAGPRLFLSAYKREAAGP